MKIDEICTASLSSPPPLSRRSSTTPSAPSSSSCLTASPTASCAPAVKPARRTQATLLPSGAVRISDWTTGISTSARLSVSSRSSLPVRTVSLTSVPAGPLIRVVDSSELAPAIERPSTSVMMSPFLSPPSAAGEPS